MSEMAEAPEQEDLGVVGTDLTEDTSGLLEDAGMGDPTQSEAPQEGFDPYNVTGLLFARKKSQKSGNRNYALCVTYTVWSIRPTWNYATHKNKWKTLLHNIAMH